MKKADIKLDDKSTGLTIIDKMDFEQVEVVFDALHYAFHPEGHDDQDVDQRFLAHWHLFLVSVGWTEEEYWTIWEESNKHHCPECGEECEVADHNDEKVLDLAPLSDKNVEVKPN